MGGCESRESSKRDGDLGSDVGTDCENRTTIVSEDVAVAGLAFLCLVVVGGMAFACRGSGDRKTMKAPGRSYRIFRDDFEDDPGQYFRDLRKK